MVIVTIDTGSATTSRRSCSTSDLSGRAITVVICAYTEQRWPQIQDAVDSVLRQEVAADQLILVIDHNPALLERARAAYPKLVVVPNAGPRGLSGARNTGVSSARGEVIAFLDDDATAEPDWLARMSGHYDDPRVLAVGGSAAPQWEGPRPRWLPSEFDWVVGCSFTGQPSAATPVRNLIGCNMSFRRSALDDAGRFDPALGRVGKVPAGCEETELCIRLRQRRPDGVVLYEPAAGVRHRVTSDRGTWSYFRRRCFSEGRSKAVVARLVGAGAALAAERDYTRRVLPRGIWRGMLEAGARRDLGGLMRSGAIVVGLLTTASGYLSYRTGLARRGVAAGAATAPPASAPAVASRNAPAAARARRPGPPGPVRVLSVELSEGIPSVPGGGSADGAAYAAVQVLVRLHGHPLGLLRIPLPAEGLTAEQHGAVIVQQLAEPIDHHLERDGLQPLATFPAQGVGWSRPCTLAQPPPAMAPPATVVVPTCGRPDVLRRCLEALTSLDYPDYEVLVVDNTPHLPGTKELVAAYEAGNRRVRYVPEPRRGTSNARNRGLTEARGRIVAFADDDVVVDRGWLKALAEGFLDEQVAGVTGLVVASELETPAQIWIEEYGGFGKGCRRQRFDRAGFETEEGDGFRRVQGAPVLLYPYSPGVFGSGANMAFRTDALRRLGGFDPLLGAGGTVLSGEDIDVLLRVVLGGRAIVYNPAAIVWHRHKRDLHALRRTMYAYGVGLSAVITKTLLASAADRRELLRRLPRGIAYAVNPRSGKNSKKMATYPGSLTMLELLGMAFGPVYYAAGASGALGARRMRRRLRVSP
jgi:cellulose synthase/poly-beta-1,6-N-acetylglucosamine synthase-like glycosyltransferase